MEKTALKNYRGFTVVEICVVIGIVVVISAISFPIWVQTKKSGREAGTKSNLHQLWLAVELYQQDQGNSFPTSGESSQMGLPNQEQFYTLLKGTKIKWNYASEKIGYGPIYYPIDRTDDTPHDSTGYFDERLRSWLKHTAKYGSASIELADFNHTEGCGRFPEVTCVFKGIGVSLDGTLSVRSANGFIHTPDWWDGKL
jgi:type II secretory pathway pseudopilin PulG